LHALHAAVQSLGGSFSATVPDYNTPVIWATGWQGLGELTKVLGKPIGGGEKGQAALIDLNCSDLPQLFAHGVHFIPHSDGTVAIGSTTERDWSDINTDGQLTDLIAKATTLVPILKGRKVLERWAGVRPKSARRTPLLGRHPTRQDHFIANGGYKIGLGLLPVVAETMADLVLDDKDTIPEKFTPTWLLNNA
jgi:glycine oxidase